MEKPSKIVGLEKCVCGLEPTLNISDVPDCGREYGFCCANCDTGVGLYADLLAAVDAWNEYGPRNRCPSHIANGVCRPPNALSAQHSDLADKNEALHVELAELYGQIHELRARVKELEGALDAAHYYIDASDEELQDEGISRGDALYIARDKRQALKGDKQ